MKDIAAPPLRAERTVPGARWWQGVRVAVSAGLLVYLIAIIDLGDALQILAGARPDLLLTMLAMAVAERFFAAWRWFILLRPSVEVGYLRVLRLVLVSTFAGYAVPGSIGIETLRIYGVTRTTSNLGHAVSSVLVERMLAVLALLLLVVLGVLLSPRILPDGLGQLTGMGFAVLVLGALLIMLPAGRRLTAASLPGAWLAPLRAKLEEVYDALDDYRGRPRLILLSLAAALLFQLVRVGLTLVGAWALGADVAWVHFLIIVPAVALVTTLPISIGGIGVQEASFVYLFGLVGMAPAAALPLSVLMHLMVLVAIVPGAWLYWRRGLAL